MGAYFKNRLLDVMKPTWIRVGKSKKEIFEILDMIADGKSVYEIAKMESSITAEEVQKLLLRTKVYLQSHIILDSYTVTSEKFVKTNKNLDWKANEIQELVSLHNSGATDKSIALIMRKNREDIKEKLKSLHLE